VTGLDAYLSPFARRPEVREALRVRPDIIICDCTAREGEQAAGVDFGAEIKVELLCQLDAIGVPQAQAGYPAKSAVDAETIRRIRGLGLRIKTEAIAQVFDANWRDEVDAAVASGADIVDIQLPCSDQRLRLLHKMTREELRQRAIEAVRYASGRVPVVRFAPTDTTRADLDYVRSLYHATLEAGAERISLADTAGAMFPPAMRWLVGEITREFDVPLQVHCHNDFGLALANTLAAAEGGAAILDATINGLGERAGNASLDELVVALEAFYGVHTGIRTEALYGLAHQMAAWTGIAVPDHKPLVGENAFAHKLEGHVQGVLVSPPLYEPLPPEAVGNRRRIPIGKYSGVQAIRHRLQQAGLDVTEDQARRVLAAVAKVWEDAPGGSLSDEAFLTLAQEALRSWPA
jgi:isopropylmalate/homocitrate/citramalate synthase